MWMKSEPDLRVQAKLLSLFWTFVVHFAILEPDEINQ